MWVGWLNWIVLEQGVGCSVRLDVNGFGSSWIADVRPHLFDFYLRSVQSSLSFVMI